MKVTHVSIRPTRQAEAAGTPALTPELLAATGARYSRSNEGLEHLLKRIDPSDPDRSIDSIFRMVDYGHQSIADMAPVALFMDGLSMHLAFCVWTVCPTAGGQESSTRYIDLAPASLPHPDLLGIPAADREAWGVAMERAFAAYRRALNAWQAVAEAEPSLTRIPAHLADDTDDKARRKVARMIRNYAFDRARYFLPAAALTNVALVMSARGWIRLCQVLCSHVLPEARALGVAVQTELGRCVPHLSRHAAAQASMERGILRELASAAALAARPWPDTLTDCRGPTARPSKPFLEAWAPPGVSGSDFAADLAFHDNRYAWVGSGLCRTGVRFGWEAVTFAEMRDLNRHRTGNKHAPPVPVGFYAAADQLPPGAPADALRAAVAELSELGRELSARSRRTMAQGDATASYWALLGTQYAFEHVTTADKFLYEAELRTGTGSHYRYAAHLRDALSLWYERYPETRGLVLEGCAEPE